MEKSENGSSNLLSEKAVTIWRIRATGLLVVFSFLIGAVFVFWNILAIILGVLGLTVYFLTIFAYCPLLYKVCGYSVNNNIVTINKGYFIHRHTKISFSKIQYCVISQGPLQKLYGVCSVIFLTAGSSEIISDISITDAQKIKISVE